MRYLKKCAWALSASVAAAVICGSQAVASESSEPPVLVMYEKVGMSGKAVTFNEAVADIDVRFPFHSTSVKSGRWEICTRNDFRGACMDVDAGAEIVSLKKEFGFFARVRSLRPIREAAPVAAATEAASIAPKSPEIISAPALEAGAAAEEAVGAPAKPVASAEAVLRGHRAHFFKTPMLGGAPIDADDAASAGDFCREAGFEQVEFMDFVLNEGRQVIGDLLCADPQGGP
ncbi:beta/gamma crystallin-related protein [Hyphococcus sp.]|uniref:beta/gamma crystallin-related protein n=1 Tax=Hyphococcus sp. TaxID=2038636 RepID=UPI003D0E17DF